MSFFQDTEKPNIGTIGRTILLLLVTMALPGVNWTLFGWVHLFLPLLVLHVLNNNGSFVAKRILLIATLISLVIYLAVGHFDLFVFSLLLITTGHVLFSAAQKKQSPFVSGFWGAATLASGWAIILYGFSLGKDVSPYAQLIQSLESGIEEAVVYYRSNETVNADTKLIIESTLVEMKKLAPIILPSILGGIVLCTIWFTMVMGNRVARHTKKNQLWEEYRYWQLPDKLIWLIIITAGLTFLSAPFFKMVGINALILGVIVYCFQGLAIVIFFFHKWKIPLFLRFFCYVMIVFQSFGALLLLLLGISETWLDMRRLNNDEQNNTM